MTAKASRRPNETVNLSKSFLLPTFTRFFLSITTFLLSDAITAQWCGMLFHIIFLDGSPFWRCLLFTLQPYSVQTRTQTKPHKIDTAIPIELTLKTPNEFHRHGMGVRVRVCVRANVCVDALVIHQPSSFAGVRSFFCVCYAFRIVIETRWAKTFQQFQRYEVAITSKHSIFHSHLMQTYATNVSHSYFFYSLTRPLVHSFLLSRLHFIARFLARICC